MIRLKVSRSACERDFLQASSRKKTSLIDSSNDSLSFRSKWDFTQLKSIDQREPKCEDRADRSCDSPRTRFTLGRLGRKSKEQADPSLRVLDRAAKIAFDSSTLDPRIKLKLRLASRATCILTLSRLVRDIAHVIRM